MTKFLIAAVATAALLAAVAACTDPSTVATDPATALAREFARHSTVRVDAELIVRADDDPGGTTYRQRGVVRLSVSGVTDSDLFMQVSGSGQSMTRHQIEVGGRTYVNSSVAGGPPQRPWLMSERDAGDALSMYASYLGGLVDVLHPGVAEALLATAGTTAPGDRMDGVETVRHQGAITSNRINQAAGKKLISYPMNVVPAALMPDVPNPWSLWIGSDGLPRRLQTSGEMVSVVPEPVSGLSMQLDLRFLEWGATHPITAPPADTVSGE
ncbi:hypothetical protein GCM10022224_041120 [Nonomuraea antimicrobica]|uniref:Lipoprotein LprG n=1 Tax=Nonomuraea antimicrobica TaxID=561173 RepID=A0ABP7C1J0_9ACTN